MGNTLLWPLIAVWSEDWYIWIICGLNGGNTKVYKVHNIAMFTDKKKWKVKDFLKKQGFKQKVCKGKWVIITSVLWAFQLK